MKTKKKKELWPKPKAANQYLNPGMPLDRVEQDAKHGVSLARQAWRLRDPDGAAAVLGNVREPGRFRERNLEVKEICKESVMNN